MSESARGRLLVATPTLYDPNFFRSVVLVLEHGADGALGVVLNRPSDTAVGENLPDWDRVASEPGVVFVGGPVAPDAAIGVARAGNAEHAEGWAPLFGHLGTIDLGRDPVELPVDVQNVRVFAGYAGWSEGQLDNELDSGGWFVVDAAPDDVFTSEPGRLWASVLRRQGGRLAMFASAPPHPSLN
ncbi:MAG TPA: YqgE/AlgH family protein [Acidimicrobiia bacterium]|nr:YqgE/AlgH family protein [Acidimicrobiia bacterium]